MTTPSEVWSIVLAGGSGQRYSVQENKLLQMLNGQPVLLWSTEVMHYLPETQGTIVVCHPQWQQQYKDVLAPLFSKKPLRFVEGGNTRRASVYHGLQALPAACAVVLIHDAARPLVDPTLVQAVLHEVLYHHAPAASLGCPVINTIKQVTPQTQWVQHTFDRASVWQVHTPQVFQTRLLKEAHDALPDDYPAYDDAQLVEAMHPEESVVKMVEDTAYNIKLTQAQDWILAQTLAENLVAI